MPYRDMLQEDTWRIFKIMAEFVEGFEQLSRQGPLITIFGSARTKKSDPMYRLARKTGRLFAENGFGIVTGAGGGIMEAANRGAIDAGGPSIGLNIALPHEQSSNEYVKTLINFHYFFIRKVMFVKYAHGTIIMPGGFGTMDELCEVLTLVQTHKTHRFPIVLMGEEHWKGYIKWMKDKLLGSGYIGENDLDLFRVTDDPKVALKTIQDNPVDISSMRLR